MRFGLYVLAMRLPFLETPTLEEKAAGSTCGPKDFEAPDSQIAQGFQKASTKEESLNHMKAPMMVLAIWEFKQIRGTSGGPEIAGLLA